MTLLDDVKKVPARNTGPKDWFAGLSPAQQAEIQDLLRTKRQDERAIPHSFTQLAEIVIQRFGLTCKANSVRCDLSTMYREIPCEKASRKR